MVVENKQISTISLAKEYHNRLKADMRFYDVEKNKLLRAMKENFGELKYIAYMRLDILDAVLVFNQSTEGKNLQ